MLQLEIKPPELFDEKANRFVPASAPATLRLEHSLVSLSKWESKWKKPFLNNDGMSAEETLDYIRCMTITQCVDPKIYDYITEKDLERIREYIDDPMTATWFKKQSGKAPSRSVITSELIYFWMTAFEIPFDPCEKWHLNRLMTLIRVCDEKNRPSKKASKKDTAAQYRSLNNARRSRMGSRG